MRPLSHVAAFKVINTELYRRDRPYACHSTTETFRDTYFTKLSGGAFPQELPCLEADVITDEKRDFLVNELLPTTVQWLR